LTIGVYQEAIDSYKKRVVEECAQRAKSCDLKAPEK
jgi:hypothetical protein